MLIFAKIRLSESKTNSFVLPSERIFNILNTMKKKLPILTFIFLIGSFGKVAYAQTSSNEIIANFSHLSPQQLSDTANYFFNKNSTDTALICFSLLINTTPKNADIEHQKMLINAYNRSAILYCYTSDYRMAYDFFIRALTLCEKINYESFIPRIYANIGSIYMDFKKYEMAKLYHLKALDMSLDTTHIVGMLNNLGNIELENGNLDSAFYFYNKALQLSKRHDNAYLYLIKNGLGIALFRKKHYDSAMYYFKLSLEGFKDNGIEKVSCLSNLGGIFFEIGKIDSALFYIDLSNRIASENNFLRILAENYLTLSKIEKSKGRKTKALEYFEKYVQLKDSIFNARKVGEINQLRRSFEVSKTNQQIEELAIEKRIKERTIFWQKIVLVVLLLISIISLLLYFEKRKLDTAYKVLVEKNVENIDLQNNSTEKLQIKYQKSALTDDKQQELLNRIFAVMEDTSIICDTEFSVDKLAELVQANSGYVSQTINTALNKTYRSLINEYRIREAQRILSEPDALKYTVESVGTMVGFKSRSTFYDIFKEITGVSPKFYLKSLQNEK
jgi:tetratricopeptide (TPR) repeat protein